MPRFYLFMAPQPEYDIFRVSGGWATFAWSLLVFSSTSKLQKHVSLRGAPSSWDLSKDASFVCSRDAALFGIHELSTPTKHSSFIVTAGTDRGRFFFWGVLQKRDTLELPGKNVLRLLATVPSTPSLLPYLIPLHLAAVRLGN